MSSEVADSCAIPGPIAVTSPVALTDATAGFELAQKTNRPNSWFPCASRGVAMKVVDCPVTIVALGGVTRTLATGTLLIVTDAVPLIPSLVAVIDTVPALTLVTRPVLETTPMDWLLELQVTARPVSVFPNASSVAADNWTKPPTTMFDVEGVTTTLATETDDTVIDALPLTPSDAAKTIALPVPTAVTSPVCDTVATDGAPVIQVMIRPGRGCPCASFGVAVSCVVAVIARLAVAGDTSMLAIATGVTVTRANTVFPSASTVTRATPCVTPVTNPLAETVAIVG